MGYFAMNLKEAAGRVGKSEDSLRRAIKAGKLEAMLIGGKYEIAVSALDAYAISHAAHTKPQADAELQRLRSENEKLKSDLDESRRILEDNRQRQDTIILQLTRQLENIQLLEYKREPWWHRWFRKKS
jgi:excisionase family DNA binding protein